MSDTVPFVPLYINGQHRRASTDATFNVYNSYSKAHASTAAAASSEDCRLAIEAAQRAFPAWEAVPLAIRRDILLRAAAIMENKEWQAKATVALMEETSATRGWAIFNIMPIASSLRNVAGTAHELKGEAFPSIFPGSQVIVQKRAHGVIYSIAPWNAPLPLTLRACALPLICGNTVVLRPSEHSPRSQSLIIDAFHEAGIPPGVLNFIPMSAQDTPILTPEIIAHPLVRKINFTGSDRVGRIIATEAGRHLKPCIFELGGKAPSVVLADADIDQAARAIVFGAFINSGQVCVSTERVIVQRSAAESLIAAVKQFVGNLVAGDPKSSIISSLFSDGSAENIVNLIKDAKANGAELLVGDGASSGALLQPHVILNVHPGMKIWKQETFGPVCVIAVVDTVDEAVELANDTPFSLACAVWTKDVHTAMNVGMRIRACSVNINGPTLHAEQGQGFAGLGGDSGYGRFDVDNFTDKRIVVLHGPGKTYPVMNL